MSGPTYVSTFAGCGGSSLGYKAAGFDPCRLAVEWEKLPAAAYREAFPGVPVFEGDIAALDADRALELAQVEPGELDLLDGSPPCQGFSTSGKRRMWDPRNELYMEFVRLLRVYRPRAFVMENVSGLVKGKMRVVFVDILRRLEESGYRVSARVLDACYFGVAQYRERLIFVGVREDLGIEPSHPKATSRRIGVREAFEQPPPVVPRTFKPNVAPTERFVWMATNPGDRAADSYRYGANRMWDWWKLHPRHPSPTIRTHPTFMHWEECRLLSIEEVARLQSFPEDFPFQGLFSQQWHQIGNSVPPKLMEAVARHVRETVLEPSLAPA